MKSFVIHAIILLVRQLLEKDTWDKLREYILQAEEMFKSGKDKREWVISQFSGIASWVLNLALEALVAQQKVSE